MPYLRGTNARVLKLALLCVLMAAAGSRVGTPLANCQGEGPYPVRQCATPAGSPAWFAPPPSDAGSVTATWWVLGFGSRLESDPRVFIAPDVGDGFQDDPVPGRFHGIDSANLNAGPATGDPNGGLDLIDALVGTGHPQSAGGFCFSASANWALPFIDGCPDMNRTYGGPGGPLDVSDDYLNPYFEFTPGTPTDYALVDAPMGVLLTESSNKSFALAFFSATDRGGDPSDILDRGFDMGAIVNGEPNPAAPAGNNNIIPWQTIPNPHVSIAIDPNGDDRIVAVNWPMIRLVHDNSSRLTSICQATDLESCPLGEDRNGNWLTGVGILEMPELVSYGIEKKPIVVAGCDPNAPWVEAGPRVVPPIATAAGAPLSTTVTVPPDTCIRLVTHLGRIPSAAFRTSPADIATRNLNRQDAQSGNLGDIGYSVTHAQGERMIGGPLLGDAPILRRAVFERRSLIVEFETPGEHGVQGYEVMARARSGSTSVVGRVGCSQCSTGIGASYTMEIPGNTLRDARSIIVVAQPSGAASNELTVTRSAERSSVPGRRLK